jgi:hypothetical protein
MQKELILKKIQSVLDDSKKAPKHQTLSFKDYDDDNNDDDEATTTHNTRLLSCIGNFSPRNSHYVKTANDEIKKLGITSSYVTVVLRGILEALRHDIESGVLDTFEQMVNGEIFLDFIEMAEYFLRKNYKDPAAVIAGGVLEEHLRKLSLKNDLPVKNGNDYIRADALNTSLRTNNVYNLVQDKIIIGWLGIRNKAAHGDYHEYDKSQVNSFIEGLLVFINNFPA